MKPSEVSAEIDDVEQISTKCMGGHKFNVGKDDIATSKSGKSFIALCPKCGKAARLRRDLVLHLFGVNARDPHQVSELLTRLSSGSASSNEDHGGGVTENKKAEDEKGIRGVEKYHDDDEYEENEDGYYQDDEDEDVDDDDDDDDYEDDDDFETPFDPSDEDEHEAEVEEVDAVAGDSEVVKRYKTQRRRDSPSNTNRTLEIVREFKRETRGSRSTPRRQSNASSPDSRKKPHTRKPRYEEEPEIPPRGVGQPRRRRPVSMFDDKPVDRNDFLKKIIAEEIGDDNDPYNRMAAMIDLQPEGVHPVYAESVLKLHFTPQMVAALLRRWESDTAIANAQKMKEQEALNMLQTTSVSYQQPPPSPMYQRSVQMPPSQGGNYIQPNQWAPWLDQERVNQQGVRDPYNRGYPQVDVSPMQYPPSPQRSPMSEVRARQMVEEMIDERFERLERAILQSKKDEAHQNEIKELRELILRVASEKGSPPPQEGTKQMDSLLNNQSNLLTLLMKNMLDSKDKSDPTQSMMLNELRNLSEELKKNQDALPLIHTSDELRQRIQLKKLENEMEMAQEEFRDKRENRQFTKDIAEQALKKIGESIAHAYVESQRVSAMQGSEPNTPPVYGSGFSDMMGGGSSQTQLPTPEDVPKAEHHVKVRTDDSGNKTVDCPTCSSPITYGLYDESVKCKVCGMEYEISRPASGVNTSTASETTVGTSDRTPPKEESMGKGNMLVPPVL